LPVIAEPGRDAAFAQALCTKVLPDLAASRGVASALYATRNVAVTQASSAKDDRAGDRYVESLIAVEVTNGTGTAAALSALTAENLRPIGGSPHLISAPCVLLMTYALQAAESG
jgi:hypothetical protein